MLSERCRSGGKPSNVSRGASGDPAKHIDEDVLEGLSESFLRDAYKPWLDFAMRVRTSEQKWLSGRGRRTEFDELLWDNFFVERESIRAGPRALDTVRYASENGGGSSALP